eukprot:UN06978
MHHGMNIGMLYQILNWSSIVLLCPDCVLILKSNVEFGMFALNRKKFDVV